MRLGHAIGSRSGASQLRLPADNPNSSAGMPADATCKPITGLGEAAGWDEFLVWVWSAEWE